MTSPPDPDRSSVVLLGSSRYHDADRLPAIPHVTRNIADLETVLTDPDFGIVPRSRCAVLLDETSLPTLGRQLRASAEQAKDLLLVYFAGHGIKAGPRHELYLAMYETDPDEPDFASLKYETLRRIVLDSPAQAKVIILDCCFSGRAFGDELAAPTKALLGQLEIEGCCLLTSAQANNVALFLPGEEHTAFTGRLLSVLNEGINGESEFITVGDLYRGLRERLSRQSLPIPLSRISRTAGSLVLSRNRAFATVAAAAMSRRFDEAAALAAAGRWPAALADLQAVAAEQARILGPDEPDTQRTRRLAAHAIGATGNPREAAHLLRELLEEQSGAYGGDHEETMHTRQFLAVNLGEAGSRTEAAAMLRILLPDRRRVLGPTHPDTLRTQHMLARNLACLGARAEAVALLRELIHACRRLDMDVPTVAWAERDLAVLTGDS
ncbi:caspase family protein [Micromonospora andamanensis]|uniref:caspase family protein n=1 Tax=Micromonospora andamanensis TaxID=1287068 RepID=UPI00194DCDA4|nr:tetratricopeptide repeat protein [Micromonospora andamanensis]